MNDPLLDSLDPYGTGPMYWDRSGKPITLRQWAEIIEKRGFEYKRVDETTIGPIWISTVLIGIDMGFRPGDRPLIFETMMFGGPWDQETWRYATEAEAIVGHLAAVAEAIKRRHGWIKYERDQRRRAMKAKLKELS